MLTGDAIGHWLGVLHQHGPESRLGMADQPRGLRVLQRLAPGRAKVSHGCEPGAGGYSSRDCETELGDSGTTGRAVRSAQTQHAGADQVTQPAPESSCMN
jgi:hypothetical protein